MSTKERVHVAPLQPDQDPGAGPENHGALRASAQHFGSEGDRILDRLLSGDSEAFGRQSRQQSGQ
jgi:hypothetical protein